MKVLKRENEKPQVGELMHLWIWFYLRLVHRVRFLLFLIITRFGSDGPITKWERLHQKVVECERVLVSYRVYAPFGTDRNSYRLILRENWFHLAFVKNHSSNLSFLIERSELLKRIFVKDSRSDHLVVWEAGTMGCLRNNLATFRYGFLGCSCSVDMVFLMAVS